MSGILIALVSIQMNILTCTQVGGGAFTAEKMGEWALPSPPGFGVNPGFREESKAVFGENDVSLRHQAIVFLKP